jgi:hypothetical protein
MEVATSDLYDQLVALGTTAMLSGLPVATTPAPTPSPSTGGSNGPVPGVSPALDIGLWQGEVCHCRLSIPLLLQQLVAAAGPQARNPHHSLDGDGSTFSGSAHNLAAAVRPSPAMPGSHKQALADVAPQSHAQPPASQRCDTAARSQPHRVPLIAEGVTLRRFNPAPALLQLDRPPSRQDRSAHHCASGPDCIGGLSQAHALPTLLFFSPTPLPSSAAAAAAPNAVVSACASPLSALPTPTFHSCPSELMAPQQVPGSQSTARPVASKPVLLMG